MALWLIITSFELDYWIYWHVLYNLSIKISYSAISDLPTSQITRTGLDWTAESESYITTDGQSASLSWNKVPIWGLRPDLNYCLTVAGLLIWGVLSDERMGLSFALTAGPRQRSQSRVQVPSDSRSYITVSDSRLPFSSPPTTRRVTLEAFDPASTRETGLLLLVTSYTVSSGTHWKHPLPSSVYMRTT
jgi:hypothetical protein